jgi:hypothetical protein
MFPRIGEITGIFIEVSEYPTGLLTGSRSGKEIVCGGGHRCSSRRCGWWGALFEILENDPDDVRIRVGALKRDAMIRSVPP